MESEHTNMSGVLDMWKAKNQNKSSDWKKNIWKSSSGGKNIKNLWWCIWQPSIATNDGQTKVKNKMVRWRDVKDC